MLTNKCLVILTYEKNVGCNKATRLCINKEGYTGTWSINKGVKVGDKVLLYIKTEAKRYERYDCVITSAKLETSNRWSFEFTWEFTNEHINSFRDVYGQHPSQFHAI